jgi:hypothetical protein
MFCDPVASTALSQRIDDEDLREAKALLEALGA